MSQPGWYPDPAGTPGGYRFWDGTTWSAEVRGGPAAPDGPSTTPNPGTPTPPNPGTPTPPGPSGRRPLVIAVLGLLLALALIVGAVVLVPRLLGAGDPAEPPPNSSSPTISSWAESPLPTPTPPPTP